MEVKMKTERVEKIGIYDKYLSLCIGTKLKKEFNEVKKEVASEWGFNSDDIIGHIGCGELVVPKLEVYKGPHEADYLWVLYVTKSQVDEIYHEDEMLFTNVCIAANIGDVDINDVIIHVVDDKLIEGICDGNGHVVPIR